MLPRSLNTPKEEQFAELREVSSEKSDEDNDNKLEMEDDTHTLEDDNTLMDLEKEHGEPDEGGLTLRDTSYSE